MSKLREILLVEDSENDVTLTLTALEQAHVANPVVVARDGQEALDFFYGASARTDGDLPAVVLLDLKLPRVDGLEVLAKLKSDEHLKRIPIVMLTSSREESDLAKSYDLGVNAYVVKPVSFEDFATAIKELGLFWAVVNQPPSRVSK